MFSQTEAAKSNFLDKAKIAREERAMEKRKELAAIKVQVCFVNCLI